MSSPEAASPALLEGVALSCRRGPVRLFHELCLAASAGEAVCLRGPNGSGKTTLLRCLAGLTRLDAGEVRWSGKPVTDGDCAFRESLAFLGHLPALKDDLTAEENLEFTLKLRGIRSDGAQRRAALDQVGLAPRLKLPARRLSAGQRRRINLARLALDPARLWLLDEPLTALDDEGQELFLTLLGAHLTSGGVCVAATHHTLAPAGGHAREVWLA